MGVRAEISSLPERRLWLPLQLPEQFLSEPRAGMEIGDLMKNTARKGPRPKQWQGEALREQEVHLGQGSEIYRLTEAKGLFGSSFYR